jgi:hypothetical protein
LTTAKLDRLETTRRRTILDRGNHRLAAQATLAAIERS